MQIFIQIIIAGLKQNITFAVRILERWESGLIHQFAKLTYLFGTGGSNPPPSAKGNPQR